MPYYSWIGINLEGKICKGKEFSRSEEYLDRCLLYRNIGLIRARKIKKLFAYIPNSLKINVISHISILLSANVRLYQAFAIVAKNVKNKYFKEILKDIENALYEGISLHSALSFHSNIFDELTCSLITSGEKSGNLAYTFNQLALHYQVMKEFKQKIKAAYFMPLLTFIFFIFIMLGIFIFVIPRFEEFFDSIKQPLPQVTELVFSISKWIRSFSFLYSGFISIVSIIILQFLLNLNYVRKYKEQVIFVIPFIGKFYQLIFKAKFFHILGMLLQSGIHITESLKISQNSINNSVIQSEINKICFEIYSGKTLYCALSSRKFFASDELKALIEIGESTANLAPLCIQAGDIYQKKVYNVINNFIKLAQPLLLVILGVFIASLIFAVYMPIFTLSSII